MRTTRPPEVVMRRVEGSVLSALLRLPEGAQRLLAGPAVERDGLRLDVSTQLMLRMERLTAEPEITDVSIAAGRDLTDRQGRLVGGSQPIGDVVDRDLPGPHGRLPIRVYTPRAMSGPSAALVFFHGGAWIYGSLVSHDALCRFLAERAGVRVIAVDYRLAPEHLFPAAVEDGLAAYDWVRHNAALLAIDPARIAVGGDSAGGTLATVVAAERRGEVAPALQLLIYPSARANADTASMGLFNEGFYLTQAMMDFSSQTYVGDPAQLEDPRVSPLLREDVSGMCPAYVAVAGFDPLRDEGEQYAEKLRAAGVDVELRRFDGLIHGFANMVGVGKAAPAAVEEVAAALSHRLMG